MKHKLKKWIKRYLPAEIVCTITAILSSSLAFALTGSHVITALAGTWGENLGYYGFMAIRDVMVSRRQHQAKKTKYGFRSFTKNIRNLVLEFGFAEALDSFLLRPFFMYIFLVILGNIPTGILLGKIAADITFYIPTIIAYELREKHLKD